MNITKYKEIKRLLNELKSLYKNPNYSILDNIVGEEYRINYNNTSNFYKGMVYPVYENIGGRPIIIDGNEELLYKVSDEFFLPVNNPNRPVQLLTPTNIIRSRYIVDQETLVQDFKVKNL